MSLIRGFPNIKFLTWKLNGDGKLRERTVMGRKGVQAGYNVRCSIPSSRRKRAKRMAEGGRQIRRTRYFYRILYRGGCKSLRNLGVPEGAKEGAMKRS